MKSSMRKTAAIALALVLCYSSSVLQGAPAAPAKAAPATAAKSEAASDAGQPAAGANQPVITLHVGCGADHRNEGHGTDCTRTLSREQFDTLLDALNPTGREVSAETRRDIAATYAQFVAFEIAGKKAGLEDTAKFRELLNWLRLRAVTDLYQRSLQKNFSTPSEAEITAYYNQHLASFERVHIARILVPRQGPASTDKSEFEKKAAAEAKLAHERAKKHEDPVKIQQDVYEALGMKLTTSTDMGSLRRAEFAEREREEVFALKRGDVSQVETEPASYSVYIVLDKDVIPKDQATAEIAREISQDKFDHETQLALGAVHAQFDEAYFGGKVSVTTGH